MNKETMDKAFLVFIGFACLILTSLMGLAWYDTVLTWSVIINLFK